MAKFLNPVEKARKEAKKREIKKNKKKRQELRSEIDKQKKQAAEDALKAAEAKLKLEHQPTTSHPHSHSSDPRHHDYGSYSGQPRHKQQIKPEQKIARTVPATNSVIESKPVIIKPKMSPFIPSSLRSRINQ